MEEHTEETAYTATATEGARSEAGSSAGPPETETTDGRSRKLTEKGRLYQLQQEELKLKTTLRLLKTISKRLLSLIDSSEKQSVVRESYTSWLALYEQFLTDHKTYSSLLEDESDVFNHDQQELTSQKHYVETWFLQCKTHKSTTGSEILPGDSASQTSRRSSTKTSKRSSVASAVSSAHFREESRKAEVNARIAALQKRRELEQEKLDLRIKEEQLELNTQLAISDAKSKVINQFTGPPVGPPTSLLEATAEPPPVQAVLKTLTTDQTLVKETYKTNSRSEQESPLYPSKHIKSNLNVNATEYTCVKPVTNTVDTAYMSHVDTNVVSHNNVYETNVHSRAMNANISGGDNQTATPTDQMMTSFVRYLRKPVPDIKPFSGNPLDYRKFMRQFNSKVVANTEDPDERMNYLDQFTSGEANRIVNGFAYLHASQGYVAALKELESRYGDAEVVANAFVKQALGWPQIKSDNPKSLDDYAIFLIECESAIQGIESVKILQYPENMKRLVQKLPFYYHDKWRNIVMSLKERGETVMFSELVAFVRREAKKATDPTYGRDALKSESQSTGNRDKGPNRQRFTKPKGIFTTTNLKSTDSSTGASIKPDGKNSQSFIPPVSAFKPPCAYCSSEQHSLEECNAISKLQYPDRTKFLKSKGLCYGCLKVNHVVKNCRGRATCKICQRRHPTICHDYSYSYNTATPKSRNEIDNKEVSTACINSSNAGTENSHEDGQSTMAIVPVSVNIKGGLKTVQTYAFLDSGSSVSFCSENLMRELGASGRTVSVTIDTMGEPHEMRTQVLQGIEVGNLNGESKFLLPKVYSKSRIPVGQEHIPTTKDVMQWPHLRNIRLPVINAEVGLLLGNNVPNAYSPLEVRTGPAGSPHATKSRLGWIVWNVVRHSSLSTTLSVNRAELTAIKEVEDLKDLDRLVRHAANMDFPERSIEDKREPSQEDKLFLHKVENSICLRDGHYYIDLPLRNDEMKFPNNSAQALQRLKSLNSKMDRNPTFKEDYKSFMHNVFEKNYAERVPEDEINTDNGRVWYIPHHGVYHPKKPDKLRVVFDCTASHQGISLNSCLLPGPDLTSTLLGVLLRFRQEFIAFMGDVESMYYQVRVPGKDCNLLRFYWWPEGDTTQKPEPHRMLVHLFGATSSPSCATAALQKTAEDNSDFSLAAKNIVKNNFYVDDCLYSVDSVEKAVSLLSELTNLCQRGGFHLTKWVSNSLEVMQSVPEHERAKEVRSLDLDSQPLPNERALGVKWAVETDMLGFNVEKKDLQPTRRAILSVVSSTFDPLGLAAPYLLNAKVILQNLCKKGASWDDEVTGSDLAAWKQWCEELPDLAKLEVERCYKPADFEPHECQLHVFSDSSNHGYGIAAYLRFSNSERVHCSLLFGKSRVAPLKRVTTPRMELTAATVAVRMAHRLQDELQYTLTKTVFWTDSMSVLRYIANEASRFHTFVANRITIIREASDPEQWHYVNTVFNPADCASRGMNLKQLLQHQCWFNGPTFLWKPEEDWPVSPDVSKQLELSDPEVKKTANTAIVGDQPTAMNKLLSHFSDWMKLKRTTAWLLLLADNLKRRVDIRKTLLEEIKRTERDPKQQNKILNNKMAALLESDKSDIKKRLKELHVTPDVCARAEKRLLQFEQKMFFPEELETLSANTLQPHQVSSVKKSSTIFKLDPVLVDGLLRVGGRLDRAHLPYETKHPVILPKTCRLAPLILRHVHRQVGHQGKNAMLNLLRRRFWITGAKSAIKTLLSKCVTCKKYQASAGQQKMADLPSERVTPDLPCFSNTGIDFFGPINVTRARSQVKRYGVIFTCMKSRAVHLEVAWSLDTDACINAIRRFISRRGPVKLIQSDNGTNLVASEKELRDEIVRWNHSKIQSALLQHEITWVFNPPSGSHFGGVWERIIRSIRKVLHSLLKDQHIKLDDESLQTLFCEVEAILNNRPISTLPDQPGDLEALTPNHLLLLQPGERFPPGIFTKTDNYVKRRWRQVQYLADQFWSRWSREYLPLLQERQKWCLPKRNLQLNDIVLLVDSSPRNSWALGRVVEVIKDKKNFVRMVRVKTKTSTLIRPVDKLCVVLEAD